MKALLILGAICSALFLPPYAGAIDATPHQMITEVLSRSEEHYSENELALEQIMRELVALKSILSWHTDHIVKLQSENAALKRELRDLRSTVDLMRTQLNFGIR